MANEGPMELPREARAVALRAETEEVARLLVEPPPGFAFRPGQFAELGAGPGTAGFFAIASAPREGAPLTFLVKAGGTASEPLLALAAGAPLTFRGPFGRPFPIASARGHDVLLIGAGTAIAPLRAALVEILAERERYGRVALVHGVRDPGDQLFAEEHAGWRARGVEVRVTTSRPDAGWTGRHGWVQAHLADLVTPGCWAFVAGMPEMEEAVLGQLAAAGVDDGRAMTNVDAQTLREMGLA